MDPVMIGIYVFVLAMLIGFEVITKVPPTLHTPLMSGANAISGITLVGALVVTSTGDSALVQWLGFAAIVFILRLGFRYQPGLLWVSLGITGRP